MGDVLDLLGLPFVQRMFAAGLLASVACGVVGTFVVVRRLVFVGGGISHASFGGIGLAYYIQDKAAWAWFDPGYGALLFAVAAAWALGTGWARRGLREDSVIGVMWVLGMALGILLLQAVDRTRVLVQDPVSLLFGNILLIGGRELVLMALLLAAVLIATVLLFKDLRLLTFDEEFARLTGVPVGALNLALLTMVALTVVLLIKVVGVILVIAMLTIPAATAGLFCRRLETMMAAAVGISAATTLTGSLVSLWTDLPPGATIVLLLAVVFAVALAARKLRARALARRGEGG